MISGEDAFLKEFFQAVTDRPLEPGDPRYVPLYSDPSLGCEDPVELLARAIKWTRRESVQLFSGFRGTGKSTELRRLKKELTEAGYRVFLLDLLDYLNFSTPVDVSDFLICIAGALGDAINEEELIGGHPAVESYWSRLKNFLSSRVELLEVSAKFDTGIGEVGLKTNLKSDPTFRQQLQERMAGHLGAFVDDVRQFLEDCVRRLRKNHRDDLEVVILVDSVEQIRGTSVNAVEVQSSVETLFAGHSDKLHIPYLHVVYTIPPYLKVRYANLGSLYQPGGVQMLPALKLRDQHDNRSDDRPVFAPGLDAMERIVAARADWKRLLGDRGALDRVSLHSGGHLRDMLRLLAEVIRRADRLPVSTAVIDLAIRQVRSEFLPIASSDAQWLHRIATTHQASLDDAARLPDLARYLDTHLALCYRNGEEWYDVHPLIREEVARQVASLAAPKPIPPGPTAS